MPAKYLVASGFNRSWQSVLFECMTVNHLQFGAYQAIGQLTCSTAREVGLYDRSSPQRPYPGQRAWYLPTKRRRYFPKGRMQRSGEQTPILECIRHPVSSRRLQMMCRVGRLTQNTHIEQEVALNQDSGLKEGLLIRRYQFVSGLLQI